MGLILDSTELIAAERTGLTARRTVLSYGEAQQIGISVISLAELQHGVERSQSAGTRRHRELFLADLLSGVPIYDIVPAIAIRAGTLDAMLQRRAAESDSAIC